MSDPLPSPAAKKHAGGTAGRLIGAVIVIAAVDLAVYVVNYLDTSPRTDDAFARANTIGVAPQVNGRIVSLRVRDNQAVKKGDVLFEVDPIPFQHSLARSRAALDGLEKQIGLSRRDVRAQQIGAEAARTNIGRIQTSGIPGWAGINEPTYGAAIFIEVPLYDGNQRSNRLGVAQSHLRIAEDELELARDQAARQVVKAYEDLKVTFRQREAATALVLAAQQSYDAAIDSYRSGVATFVDVTNAQTALTRARTAETDTRSQQFSTMAALAFSTGDLAPPGAESAPFGGAAGRRP